MTSKLRAAVKKTTKPVAAKTASASSKRNTSDPSTQPESGSDFTIVAIGASAGGLEALENFMKNVPADTGMAFIVIQHLDPTHKGMLPELLQRASDMPVFQVKNRMKVVPDCVYVIPPNKDMSIAQGSLYLSTPAAPRGQRLPIDTFFRALADERREHSVGVILSGMGSDGSQGVVAIKENGGLVIAQQPLTAKFDSMPRSAIATGSTDVVAPAEELPKRILDYFQQRSSAAAPDSTPEVFSSTWKEIIIRLRERTGRDFSLYKQSSIHRRIERRMSIHQIDQVKDYARYVKDNPLELDLLLKELLIGVTNFFRDPAVWSHLIDDAIPAILEAYPDGRAMRAWVAGCSTGEEAYSLAIAFKEAVEKTKLQGRYLLHIFATDLDQDAIAKARRGVFSRDITANVSTERLKRFFIEEGDSYRICQEIREMITFAPQDLTQDSPFTRLDILSCRNLLIYLGADLHKKLLPLFHYSLNPAGILMLGGAETIGSFSNLFTPSDRKARIYRRLENTQQATAIDFPTAAHPHSTQASAAIKKEAPAANIQSLADQLLLQKFSPAAVLVNAEGDIIYISGRTGKYLEPAAGKANWNIHAMARNGLRNALAGALLKATRQKNRVTVPKVEIQIDNTTLIIDLTVEAIEQPAPLSGMLMVIFTEVPALKTADPDQIRHSTFSRAEIIELEEALQHALEENRVIREEMETTREELKSANEELQSNNEELQSTNEELTSSREEMQSMNEELQTINAELQSKVEDLSRTSNDMKNLLDSTDIATVFLDNRLHVRRFTTKATQIFKLIPGDAGRALSDIVTDLQYPALQDDAREVLRTLVFQEKQITTHDKRWFKVRIMPYRTQDNVIDGVVITFFDISVSKALEAELRGNDSRHK